MGGVPGGGGAGRHSLERESAVNRTMATIGRILQLLGMVLVIYALFVGAILRSMQGELTYLFAGIAVFVLGWLVGSARRS